MKTGKQITLGGTPYDLGELHFNEENIEVLESLMNNELLRPGGLKNFVRALRESLTDANGEDVANEALSQLKMRLPGEDGIIQAAQALAGSVMDSQG